MHEGETNFITNLLRNPNFINALAQGGIGFDPKGAGGKLGDIAQTLNKSQQAQSALGKKTAARQNRIAQLIQGLGGFTESGTPGVNTVGQTTQGGLKLDLDLPSLEEGGGSPVFDLESLGTGVSNVPAATTGQRRRNFQISDLIPFS